MYRFLSPLIVNSLHASLLTVLHVVHAIVRLSSGKTVVSILHFAMMVNKIDRPNTTPTICDICTFAAPFIFSP